MYLDSVDLVAQAVGVLTDGLLLCQAPLNLTDPVHHVDDGGVTLPVLLNHGLLQNTHSPTSAPVPTQRLPAPPCQHCLSVGTPHGAATLTPGGRGAASDGYVQRPQ